MAQTTSLVFNGGVIPSPSPAPAGSGKAKLLKIGEITVTEQEVQVTKKVICDPDSVTTVAPFMEVLTSAKLAELISANSILVLDDGTVQYLMADATVVVEDGTSVCTSVSFLGLSLEDRAKVLYPCTRITDELTLQQVLEVGEPVETNFDLVKAYPEDTEAGTLIDKLMVEDTYEPDHDTLLEIVQSEDSEGHARVAINEDNLRDHVDGINNTLDSIIKTIDELDVDSVPHAYLGSTLFQSAGDSVTTGTPINVFSCTSPLVGDCFEFEQTTTIDDTPFGYLWIEPGTYLINASVTLQWVGDPRGTFIAKVGKIMGENFDFSQEQELKRQSTQVVTIPNRMKLSVNITYDAGTPVMGFWIQSMQVVKLAGGMSQTNIIHDDTLVGRGSVADPLGVDEEKVAQSTLAGNLASAFDPTRTVENPYIAYTDSCVREGELYECVVNHSGTWNPSHFRKANFDELVKKITNGFGDSSISRNTKDACIEINYDIIGRPNSYAIYNPGDNTFSYGSSEDWTCALVDAKKLRHCSVVAGDRSFATLIPAVIWLDEEKNVVGIEFGDIRVSMNTTLKRIDRDVFAPRNAVYALVNRRISNNADMKYNYLYFTRDFSVIGESKVSIPTSMDNSYISIENGVVTIASAGNWKIGIVPVENLKKAVTYAGTIQTNIPPIAFFKGDTISTDNFICQFYGKYADAQAAYVDLEVPVPPGATFAAINLVKNRETSDMGAYYRLTKVNSYPIVVVSKDGNGDYTSINEAVQQAAQDSVIMVLPGTYEENVRSFAKRVHILGIDRKSCVLVSYDGRYDHPALEIAAGSVTNMTVMSLYDAVKTQLTGEENVRAYAVHVENTQGSQSVAEGHNLVFKDCIFKSDFFPAIGCGGFVNWEFRIENCDIINNQSSEVSPPIYEGTLGALYVHSQNGGNSGNGNVVVKNCIIKCINYSNALCMYDLQPGNRTMSFTFFENVLVSTAGFNNNIFWRRVTTPFGNTMIKNVDCWGNSNSQLNN